MIRTKAYSVAFKILISFFAFTGIVLQTGLYKAEFDFSSFRMFTNISNLICGVYFILAAAFIAADKSRDGGASPFPFLKGFCTMSILLTGIVATAIIADEFDPHTGPGIATVILHIITPILITADWLIFDKKGRFRKTYPFIWIFSPLLYLIYILISAPFMSTGDPLRFPYPFIDYESLGIPLFLLSILIVSVLYIFIGYLCFMVDRKMGKLEKTSDIPLS